MENKEKEYAKLPLSVRNKNIQNIAVIINTLDAVLFPNIIKICEADLDRFKFINTVQRELGGESIDKESIYKFCVAFEQNI